MSTMKKKKLDKTESLGKDKLNTIEVLISKSLIDSCINHDEFVSVNNVLKNIMKQKLLCNMSYKKSRNVLRQL